MLIYSVELILKIYYLRVLSRTLLPRLFSQYTSGVLDSPWALWLRGYVHKLYKECIIA